MNSIDIAVRQQGSEAISPASAREWIIRPEADILGPSPPTTFMLQ